MVFDLFSRVDYSYSNFTFSKFLIWITGLIWFFWRFNLYFSCSSRIYNLFSFMLGWHYRNVKSESLKNFKVSYYWISGLFFIILVRNLWGLIPYVFGLTTQLVWTITLSLVVWLGIVISSIEYNFVYFLSHMTPQGSPLLLAPILNLIEIVSLFIRPLTLSLRLSINMTTGHILISLLRTAVGVRFFSSFTFILLVFLIRGYLLFELGICAIQGLVFRLLRSQYLGEHSH